MKWLFEGVYIDTCKNIRIGKLLLIFRKVCAQCMNYMIDNRLVSLLHHAQLTEISVKRVWYEAIYPTSSCVEESLCPAFSAFQRFYLIWYQYQVSKHVGVFGNPSLYQKMYMHSLYTCQY